MSDGDFDGDGSDGEAFDLNHNGTSADELILFAAITDDDGAPQSSGSGPAKRSGCLLPVGALALFALALLAI